MLVIRNEQIQHFIAANENELVGVISQSIRKACDDRVANFGDRELGDAVRIGIERARSHQLTNAEDMAAFIAVMFAIAPRFDEQPEIRQLLSSTILSPGARFYQMLDRASDKAWTEAERKYEDSFWFPDSGVATT